jgi:predicted RNA binding protein YcfA (HicA-like mRNA interferase family)
LRHADERRTTVAVHESRDIPLETLRRILAEVAPGVKELA